MCIFHSYNVYISHLQYLYLTVTMCLFHSYNVFISQLQCVYFTVTMCLFHSYNVFISRENGTQQKFSEVLKVKAGGVYTVIVYQDPGPPSQVGSRDFLILTHAHSEIH